MIIGGYILFLDLDVFFCPKQNLYVLLVIFYVKNKLLLKKNICYIQIQMTFKMVFLGFPNLNYKLAKSSNITIRFLLLRRSFFKFG